MKIKPVPWSDIVDIRKVYKSSTWNKTHLCYVRGVRVDKIMPVEGQPGYVWCRFPDERVMVVCERNISAVAMSRNLTINKGAIKYGAAA